MRRRRTGPTGRPRRLRTCPKLHAVAGIADTDDLLLSVVRLANDTEILHVEAVIDALPHRGIGRPMVIEIRYHYITLCHSAADLHLPD